MGRNWLWDSEFVPSLLWAHRSPPREAGLDCFWDLSGIYPEGGPDLYRGVAKS